MIDFYLADPIANLKNFAEYGWDEELEELAEQYIEKFVEEILLQNAAAAVSHSTLSLVWETRGVKLWYCLNAR